MVSYVNLNVRSEIISDRTREFLRSCIYTAGRIFIIKLKTG